MKQICGFPFGQPPPVATKACAESFWSSFHDAQGVLAWPAPQLDRALKGPMANKGVAT